MRSPLEQFDVINIKSIYTILTDISFQNIFIPFICLIICLILYIFINIYNINFISFYFQYILEFLYNILIGIVKQQTGSYGLFWFTFVFNLFIFIFFCNLLSLIPFGIAITSNIILIFWLSSTICTSIFIIGLFRFNLKFLHIFIPQSPFILLIFLIPIEIFSYIIRLFSLAIRLAANIIAGHTLVHIIVNCFFNVIKIDKILSILILIPLFCILILELGVAFLQAYVFTVLFCIYLKDTEKGGSH